MRLSSNFALPLAVLFVLLLVPQAALAGTKSCPIEPAQNVPIASGDVFAGPNCTLNTTGDVDSFVFKANSGDIWHLLEAGNGVGNHSINVCLALYDPNAKQIFSECSDDLGSRFANMTDQKLTTTGSYTIVVSEQTDGVLNYGVSLERLYPTPPDGQKVALAQSVAGSLSPGEDSPAFTFKGVTTATYQAAVSIPNGNHVPNLCMNVYFPDGTSGGSGCTDALGSRWTVYIDFTPPQSGTYMVLLYEAASVGSGTESYGVEVSCLVGKCASFPPPPCTLIDRANYNATSNTLTMNFTVGNKAVATWNIWLTSQSNTTPLSGFPVTRPITNPPVTVIETTSLSPEGTVGVLSTLTTPTKGIICSSWVQVDTGTP